MKDEIIKIGKTSPTKYSDRDDIYSANAISPTLEAAMGIGGGHVPYIIYKNNNAL